MSAIEVSVKQTNESSKLKKLNFSNRIRNLLREMWRSKYAYLYITPFLICFAIFIFGPVIASIGLSFTYYNGVQTPRFIGWEHYQYLLSQDILFLKYALPITLKFALIVGPGGYIGSFIVAWLIAQIPDKIRLWIVLAFFAPSLTLGTAMAVIWVPLLSGDRLGYLNSWLLKLGIIDKPQLWTLDKAYLMDSMIVVSLWSSAGIGFLALLAGILNIDKTLYEAARIDGMKSRLQEVWYITIPMMKPQMLFAAVMAIVSSFKAGSLGVELSGQFPTPQYAGHTLVNHIEDYGLLRFEMGYASALSVFLLIIIFMFNRLSWRLFGTRGDE